MNEKSITTITLKKINKKSVYQYIYEHRQTAKQQIVQDLTMGLSTVSQNLNVLEKEGLISRDGFFESTGGRKAQVIQIVPEYRIAVGVGILKNMFHLAAVNLYGERSQRKRSLCRLRRVMRIMTGLHHLWNHSLTVTGMTGKRSSVYQLRRREYRRRTGSRCFTERFSTIRI